MPKHSRTSSGHHNRYANPMPVPLAPSTTAPMYNSRLTMSTPTYYSSVPPAGPPALQSQGPPYDPYPTTAAPGPTPPPGPSIPPHRASSGAWTPQDDQSLLAARAQGLNWGQIQMAYFPTKTPNACRKRHERLMERRGADDWDTRKLERLAQEYMTIRKEIWSPLAARTGEKWNVVEAKCMSNGLKNLQSAARAGARRERLESGGQQQLPPGYDDDSGISGIGLTPVDELDASYSSPETAVSGGPHSAGSSRSSSSSGGGACYQTATAAAMHHHHPLQSLPHTTANHYGYGHPSGPHHGYSSSVSSTGTSAGIGGYGPPTGHPHPHSHSQSGSPYLSHGQRLSSVDMGIDGVLNPPPVRGGGPNGI